MESSRVRVTGSGQVSLPAALRRRWGAGSVIVIDKGGYAIVRPVPDDPIAALQGLRGNAGPVSDDVRAADRRDEPDSRP
jgi:bifunctional DNA-binding transcriptional regulator/antitoxin component of YhaV-PrlF toxin-antitoxin module